MSLGQKNVEKVVHKVTTLCEQPIIRFSENQHLYIHLYFTKEMVVVALIGI